MSKSTIESLIAMIVGGVLLHHLTAPKPAPPPTTPAPKVQPEKKRVFPLRQEAPGKPVEGGRVAPDGVTQMQCDLPVSCRKRNISSKGLGCCVFRSGDYAAHWQQVPALYDLPERMKKAGIEGGGWPEKVDEVFKQLAPGVQYVQDTSGDAAILQAILASGRMACVTYNGHDMHYGWNKSIGHMVTLVHFDGKWACISDNNFTDSNEFVWMSPDEFLKRWKGQGGGWVYCLLAPPPPPIPHN